ncbi:MAG TPA: bifunctional oligoribonuclease/PAP phosphatase NrnA [Defluviitoga sp.]|nr:bifunctional oligoribonuclease/PAP phosphatase NrnA [Defluviitoga sp.]HOP23807.1 bifunctional oligoribonuclease/PAP phosphatase NrnA [Defluviitoga sp.]HPZ28446.1 bifunctional oligoribonuclease/PAP phosphatase NrnA [Defluviitoga sp.]HQD62820.1 bifunctional oligoribonuclease/PAP phosphatase NrnA [Defluviitoga sp.]
MHDVDEKVVASEIKKSNNILLVGHILPDGDAVSSLVSMSLGLEKLGKRTLAIIDDEIGEYLLEFPLVKEKIKRLDSEIEQMMFNEFDLMLILDASSPDRIGRIEKYLSYFHVIVIDHHITNTYYGNINWVDPSMGATAQMIYKLLSFLNVDYDEQLATMNLLGIATDTGFFKYENTGAETFRVAASLTEKGANISYISNRIHGNTPVEHIYLYRDVISKLKLASKGMIAYSLITLGMLSKYNILPKDSPSLVENLRSIKGVEVAMVFQEYEKNLYHVSLRSKEWADVSKIALEFGGGGHPRAAGFSIRTDNIDFEIQKIVEYITNFLEN